MSHHGRARSGKSRRIVTATLAILAAVAIAAGVILYNKSSDHAGPLPVNLPPASASYLGVFTKGVPDSYTGINAFTSATGAKPDVIMYYSGWYMPFPTRIREHRGQQRRGATGADGPGSRQNRRDRGRKVRRLPEPIRRDASAPTATRSS